MTFFCYASLIFIFYVFYVINLIYSLMLITENCDLAPEGKLRTFLSYPHCRVALNLETGKTYLIMGLARDIRKDEANNSWVNED